LEEEQLLLGNPIDYLVLKPQYARSYCRERVTPNWVSWHVSRDWLGAADRQDDFRSDPQLPEGWYRVTASS
jgi:endonuclease G